MLQSNCPDNETISRCAKGQLDQRAQQGLLEHFSQCEACQRVFDESRKCESTAKEGEDRRLNDETEFRDESPNNVNRPTGDLIAPVAADMSFDLDSIDSNLENDPTDVTISRIDPPSQGVPTKAFIGRYLISGILGKGGFGVVYLAFDSRLDRRVAIKLPHQRTIQNDFHRKIYLEEARTLASLDHHSIVPVFDFGVVPDGRCFVVSKYIEGQDLSRLMENDKVELKRAMEILAEVATALDYVHEAKVVHRDIKPGNLLVGKDGRVYVADFGLAMRESVTDPRMNTAGTPSYMSPEQARGEGHRIDGRSDQFSLGCVMYELLTGNKPFVGSSTMEVLDKLLKLDPIPPREINANVPKELNRICLKLLSKLASQRYTRTIELASDLKQWIDRQEAEGDESTVLTSPALTGSSRSKLNPSVTVVPRGLRAFTRDDAYFFLPLLPGARDRDGIPESLSHWQKWVVSADESPEEHRVGVISGPTGCGKSSFVRAGLIPLLDRSVATVIVEASADQTETKLAEAINRRCDQHLAEKLSDCLAMVRRGSGLASDRKVLIVIDQFEQWLHAHPDPQDTELVKAIRQCDGERVRCIILVRDDFWLALSRFMEVVESPLMLGRNASMIDLFDRRHAKKVLIEFGRGYGRLAPEPKPLSRDEHRFIDQVLENLATDGKIFPVHLSLFAEMVKSRDWLPATLKQVGGAVGVGEQFLNEAFSASYTPAAQRSHELAARCVLQSLLPDVTTEIKASRRPRSELLEVSGYQEQPERFNSLMHLMEHDLKLISATENLDKSRSESGVFSMQQTTYQLSHDFLVPSIREWINSRQRETFRGRLHGRLTEQTSIWNHQRESRFLPTIFSWFLFRTLLSPRAMTPSERDMLSAKDRHAWTSIAIFCGVALVLTLGIRQFQTRIHAAYLVEQLKTAGLSTAPIVVEQAAPLQAYVRPMVQSALSNSEPGSETWFILQLAMSKWTSENSDDVFSYLLDAPIEYVPVVRNALIPCSDRLAQRCWDLLESSQKDSNSIATEPSDAKAANRRLRSAQLLAAFDPPTSPGTKERWQSIAEDVSQHLVQAYKDHPDQFATLSKLLEPAAEVMVKPLSRAIGAQDEIDPRLALSLLITYTAQHDEALRTKQCLDASPWQIKLLVPPAYELRSEVLWEAVRSKQAAGLSESDRIAFARRKALAVSLLLAIPDSEDSGELWNFLKRDPMPDLRSNLILNLARMNVPLGRVIARLRRESDPDVTSGLLMAIGEYSSSDPALTDSIKSHVRELFLSDPDAGIHFCAEWLLRRWGENHFISNLPKSSADLMASGPRSPTRWINSPNQIAFVKVDASSQSGIYRDFLVSAKEVTWKQYRECFPDKTSSADFAPTDDCPAGRVNWPDALAYCNWLSDQEGIPESEYCYPKNILDLPDWVPDLEHLSRNGYRLLTPEEWVFACRAGTDAERFCGNDTTVLTGYAWHDANAEKVNGEAVYRSMPVGLLKPNDWGLFDMYGNVQEWCDGISQSQKTHRAACGTRPLTSAVSTKSDDVVGHPPLLNFDSVGFRLARTIKSR